MRARPRAGVDITGIRFDVRDDRRHGHGLLALAGHRVEDPLAGVFRLAATGQHQRDRREHAHGGTARTIRATVVSIHELTIRPRHRGAEPEARNG